MSSRGELRQRFACVDDMVETCSLDVADRGDLVHPDPGEARDTRQEKIGALMGLPRTTVSWLQRRALDKLEQDAALRQVHEESEEQIAKRDADVYGLVPLRRHSNQVLHRISEG